MESKHFIKSWSLRVVLFIAFIGMLPQIASPITLKNDNLSDECVFILIDGQWIWVNRSISNTIPFTAYIDDNILLIENSKPNCNITISILNLSSQTVLKESILKAESSYVTIPIDMLPDGQYKLEIKNDFGGYVYGSFFINSGY